MANSFAVVRVGILETHNFPPPCIKQMRTEVMADSFFLNRGNVVAKETVVALLARFRAGDRDAGGELADRFAPSVRRAIRARLAGSPLRRVLDSDDLVQSVFRTFWKERERLRVTGSGDLADWLFKVAQNRIARNGRMAVAKKRGGGIVDAGPTALSAVSDNAQGILSAIATQEILRQVLDKLTPDDRRVAEGRANGLSWEELAGHEGISAEALRKRFARAIHSLSQPLE